jgi:hypothetical protein
VSASTPPPLGTFGWFGGIRDADYHADRCRVSSSTLKMLVRRSSAHAKAELDEPKPRTPALLLGQGAHARVLEPETFAERYAIEPRKWDRRRKADKEEAAAFEAEHAGKTILSRADGDRVERIAQAVEAHPTARHAVRGGQAEISGFGQDQETGVHFRIRADYLREADGIMTDVKTAADAGPDAFRKAIYAHAYHLQAAMYAHGFRVITGEPLRDFLFVTVEKAPPFAVAVYRLDEDALAVGRRLHRQALRTWADCLARDHWPAYSARVESISLPPWAFNQLEAEDDEDF